MQLQQLYEATNALTTMLMSFMVLILNKLLRPMAEKNIKHVRKASTGWRLMKLTTVFNCVMKSELTTLKLTKDQFSILMTLLENDGINQREISEKAQLPGYAVTRSLDALEKENFIIRCKNRESRRCFSILLTEKGHQIRPTLIDTIEKVNSVVLNNLTQEESKSLDEVLVKLLTKQ